MHQNQIINSTSCIFDSKVSPNDDKNPPLRHFETSYVFILTYYGNPHFSDDLLQLSTVLQSAQLNIHSSSHLFKLAQDAFRYALPGGPSISASGASSSTSSSSSSGSSHLQPPHHHHSSNLPGHLQGVAHSQTASDHGHHQQQQQQHQMPPQHSPALLNVAFQLGLQVRIRSLYIFYAKNVKLNVHFSFLGFRFCA